MGGGGDRGSDGELSREAEEAVSEDEMEADLPRSRGEGSSEAGGLRLDLRLNLSLD
jgi:hypothetical protein